jgi:hypothetical protein
MTCMRDKRAYSSCLFTVCSVAKVRLRCTGAQESRNPGHLVGLAVILCAVVPNILSIVTASSLFAYKNMHRTESAT